MDLAMALAAEQRRRPRGRQRPRRRPLRRRRPGAARLADAARRRGRRAARRTTCSRRGKQGVYASSIVSSSLLGKMAAAAGQPLRRDAHRLQVDRPGRRASRSATRRRWATASTPSTCATRTASPRCCWSASSPPRPRPTGRTLPDLLDDIALEHGLHATDQLSVRVTTWPRSPRRWSGCATTPPDLARRPRRRARSTTSRWARDGLPPTDGPALPARRRRPGDRAARAAPSRSSSATSRWSSPSRSTTAASTPPASPPPAASTRSRKTSATRLKGSCEGSSVSSRFRWSSSEVSTRLDHQDATSRDPPRWSASR